MTLKILEARFGGSAAFSMKPKVKLFLHCSCGTDFSKNEKFPCDNVGVVRPAKCPKCKKIDYIQHDITNYEQYLLQDELGWGFKYNYLAQIVRLDE
jgi:hypothetical protein